MTRILNKLDFNLQNAKGKSFLANMFFLFFNKNYFIISLSERFVVNTMFRGNQFPIEPRLKTTEINLIISTIPDCSNVD